MRMKREELIININKSTRLPRILLDQDDVIADLNGPLIEMLNDKFGKDYSPEEIEEFDLRNYYGKSVQKELKQPGLYYNLKPKNDAISVIKRLVEQKQKTHSPSIIYLI